MGRKSVASKTTLNAKNLEALGAPRLAELLIELSTGDAAAKRRLRLELVGTGSTEDVAREIRKRLTTIAKARSYVDWQKRKALVKDLDTQRRAIVKQVAKTDPATALELMWRFLGLASSVFERCDDSSGTVIAVFDKAVENLGEIATAAQPDPARLADEVFQALTDNGFGQYDGLIGVLAPALGPEGLEHLKSRMVVLAGQPVGRPSGAKRQVSGYGLSGPVYADEVKERSRLSTARLALMAIADAQGDVDAFISLYEQKARKVPKVAAEIARRLLTAGRSEEAWHTIEAAEPRSGGRDAPDLDWVDARIGVLEALGRAEEAQAARWSAFELALSAEHLRAYLKRLPDFEDMEAEDRALAHVERHTSLLHALAFLVSWPALARAAALVLRRAKEIDGDHYEVLTPAADALSGKHPLAATLVLRAMIDFALSHSRASRYRHAARHLLECESLASYVPDWGTVEPHDAYVARLKKQHARKSAFWSLVG
jgi:tetratricopeptide (TPR) repeat protein